MVKKRLFLLVTFFLITLLVVGACGSKTTTTTTSTTSPATTSATTASTTSATTNPANQPKYGGNLRLSSFASPMNVGYFPGATFSDTSFWVYYAETFMAIDGDGSLIPVLALSYNFNPDNMTLTWNLREGVKFHDGTDFDADAAAWTFQKTMDVGTLQYSANINSIDVLNKYTLQFSLKKFNLTMLTYFATEVYFFSPTAFNTHGEDWARMNEVGTGPFIIEDWARDNYMFMVRNNDYWREGRPYLDRIEVYCILDVNASIVAFENKEIDYGVSTSATEDMLALLASEGALLTTSGHYSMVYLIPDTNNPESPLCKKEVREAIGYAMDRGNYNAVTGQEGWTTYEIVPPIAPIFDETFEPRTYNPQKARDLLASVGYSASNPLKIKFTYFLPVETLAAPIQANLADVGIELDLELTDLGRYQTITREGWDGLCVGFYSVQSPDKINPFLTTLGPMPTNPSLPSLARSPEYLALCDQIQEAQDMATLTSLASQMVRQIADELMVIPIVSGISGRQPYWPYVHMPVDSSGSERSWYYDWWMDQ